MQHVKRGGSTCGEAVFSAAKHPDRCVAVLLQCAAKAMNLKGNKYIRC
jgi:hypothetical protein